MIGCQDAGGSYLLPSIAVPCLLSLNCVYVLFFSGPRGHVFAQARRCLTYYRQSSPCLCGIRYVCAGGPRLGVIPPVAVSPHVCDSPGRVPYGLPSSVHRKTGSVRGGHLICFWQEGPCIGLSAVGMYFMQIRWRTRARISDI